jgi:hypothetical protein
MKFSFLLLLICLLLVCFNEARKLSNFRFHKVHKHYNIPLHISINTLIFIIQSTQEWMKQITNDIQIW